MASYLLILGLFGVWLFINVFAKQYAVKQLIDLRSSKRFKLSYNLILVLNVVFGVLFFVLFQEIDIELLPWIVSASMLFFIGFVQDLKPYQLFKSHFLITLSLLIFLVTLSVEFNSSIDSWFYKWGFACLILVAALLTFQLLRQIKNSKYFYILASVVVLAIVYFIINKQWFFAIINSMFIVTFLGSLLSSSFKHSLKFFQQSHAEKLIVGFILWTSSLQILFQLM